MRFTNRESEIIELKQELKQEKAFIVLVGRRRIGKSALAKKVMETSNIPGFISQAIEGSPAVQVEQIVADLKELLPEGIGIRNWQEFFSSLALVNKPAILFIDELPYLCVSDPSFGSRLQQFIDTKMPKNLKIIVAGSSQSTMFSQALSASSPLYGRGFILNLGPMTYKAYCSFFGFSGMKDEHFLIYSLTGGVPRYWQMVRKKEDAVKLATRIFMKKNCFFENEILRLLKDEGIGLAVASILNAVGKGARKPSEIASHLQSPISNLSRPLELLRQTYLLSREVPFGESGRNNKKSLYKLSDFSTLFWYSSALPHKIHWPSYDDTEKLEIIIRHASVILEEELRLFYNGSRYWDANIELDCVSQEETDTIITEVKWRKLSKKEKTRIEQDLQEKIKKSKISTKQCKIRVLDRKEIFNLLLA